MDYILPFEKIGKENSDLAGGKGASLGEMTKAGIPVPEGFVILADTFREVIKDNNLAAEISRLLKAVKVEDTESVDEASKKIRELIAKAKTPENIEQEILKHFDELKAEHVAVRSSATAEDSTTASWAGELETYLNTTRENLLETVKKCWSSLFTPRAIFYRIEKKMQNEDVAVAIAIQKMVASEISGIAFTVHPVTKDANSMVIEAGWGLGEAIVGGQITPDTYTIDKKNMKVANIYKSEQEMMIIRDGNETKEGTVSPDKKDKQKLSKAQILELAEICTKIETHYGKPQDIEWAYQNNKFYIVQSRPITTL